MLAKDFFGTVVVSEESRVRFLRKHRVFMNDEDMVCPGKKGGSYCGSKIVTRCEKSKSKGSSCSPVFQCRKRVCRRKFAVRSTNHLFHHGLDYLGRHVSMLSIREIMILLYIFLYCEHGSISEAMTKTGHSRQAVCDWFSHFRDTITKSIEWLPSLVGTVSNPVEIDESYFRGKRKYKRGRLLDGDKQSKGETVARKLNDINISEWNDIHEWRTDIPEDEVYLTQMRKVPVSLLDVRTMVSKCLALGL